MYAKSQLIYCLLSYCSKFAPKQMVDRQCQRTIRNVNSSAFGFRVRKAPKCQFKAQRPVNREGDDAYFLPKMMPAAAAAAAGKIK